MSPIWSLERLFEPPAAIEARLREKQAFELREQDGGEADPPTFQCRVCQYESQERGYCPQCLADTMERVARRRQEP